MANYAEWLLGALLAGHFYVLCAGFTNSDIGDCDYNETRVVYVPVKKTRLVERRPTGFFKFSKKTKTSWEEYEELEPVAQVQLVRDCCSGYRLSEQDTCEPICERGCPQHAVCKEPGHCQCQLGYVHFESAHECRPHCSSSCPYGGRCVEPGRCQCAAGYRSERGTCVPECTAGDGCRNGRCIAAAQCVCNAGYQKNAETDVCEEAGPDETTEWYEQSTHSGWDANVGSGGGDSGSGSFNDIGSGSDFGSGSGSGSGELFASECDCNMEFGICTSDGLCACADGYVLQQAESVGDIEAAPICAALLAASGRDGTARWLSGVLFTVGALTVCLLLALVALGFRFWQRRRGKMDVAGKTDLCCKYDKRGSSSTNIMAA